MDGIYYNEIDSIQGITDFLKNEVKNVSEMMFGLSYDELDDEGCDIVLSIVNRRHGTRLAR